MKKNMIMAVTTVAGLGVVFGLHTTALAETKKAAPAPAPMAAPVPPASISGKVATTMTSGGYTYMELEGADKSKIWIAAPQMAVKVGDQVSAPGGMPMADFTSKTLNRTFSSIIFVESATIGGSGGGKGAAKSAAPAANAPQAQAVHPGLDKKPQQEVKKGSVEKAKGGYTIADIFAKKDSLKGKTVTVKGKVTKVSQGIMGKTWVHIQDGSGKEGTNDLTVTTTQTAAVGDVVVISGPLSVGKDFGMGYFYEAIVENGTISK